jgi:type III restriction enzyme
MSNKPPPSRRVAPSELKGQARVIHEIRRLVDEWRGFTLGNAAAPYPEEPARYEPVTDGDQPLTETSMTLLQHWFRHEAHALRNTGEAVSFKYWPHQRRLVETFIYLHEVRRIRRTEQLYSLAGVDPLAPQRDPWAKLGGDLATGSGKTKMMSLLVAWAYLNALREPTSSLGFGRHTILIAPGLFVRDRLLHDFAPEGTRPSIFWSDPVIPTEFESIWDLKVYGPDTCPMLLEPDEGVLVVTNFHQLLRTREDETTEVGEPRERRQLNLLFEDDDPARLEAVSTPLIERFGQSKGIFVINDEAHHVWDESGHARFEQKAKDKAKLSGDPEAETAMAWIRSIRRLNGSADSEGQVALQVDLSATLFEEQGTKQGAKTEFKPTDWFLHTVVRYGLAEAISDGIVKKPVLERVVAKNKKTGQPEPLVRAGQPNAWERYKHLLVTGIERWKKVRDQLSDEGDPRKPILFVLCSDKKEAREVTNYMAHGEAVDEDLSHRIPIGYADPQTKKPLFLEPSAEGSPISTVIEIHIGEKQNSNEAEWESVRQSVNAIDLDEIPDPEGARDEHGQPIMIPNPYNVVVSVMMLKEGWDVRNVKVIVPLRPCESKTLTEQTLGRGLRKMHAPIIDDEGAAELCPEELYVIEHPSFEKILDQIRDIIEEKSSDEIDHAREYVPILQNADADARDQTEVQLVRFEGLTHVPVDWRDAFDLAKVPALTPKVPWLEEIPETEIQTFLKRALEQGEQEGQRFSLPANPSYRDFAHVIEAVYVIPLLRDLRTSYQHKLAVRGIVQEYLEKKTFAIPMGIPLSFDKVIESGDAKIALGNLARPEVVDPVRKTLLPALHEAISAEKSTTKPVLTRRRSSELRNYQALKKNVLQNIQRSTFTSAAVDSGDELRVAALLDRASDVVGWVYNHRSGVGYHIEYAWKGRTSRYYPDFIVRAKLGEVMHNFIVEVKGRMDERDKMKARRGREYCDLLTEYDNEPWHYLLLLENASEGRTDIAWWEQRSSGEILHVLKEHESMPLVPRGGSRPPKVPPFSVEESVPEVDQYQSALPVYDLQVSAGTFGKSPAPELAGWARVQSGRQLDRRMFVARVVGKSMEEGIPQGSWALFRQYPNGFTPAATALDGKRLVVQLRDEADPDTGGKYTLKRWWVTKRDADGGAVQIELRPDNPTFKPRRYSAEAGDIRVVAEFLEVVG